MGSTASLPRGAALLRTYSPAVGALPAERLKPLPTGIFSPNPPTNTFFFVLKLVTGMQTPHAHCCKKRFAFRIYPLDFGPAPIHLFCLLTF